MPTYPGKSPAIRPPSSGGRNYGSVGYDTWPVAIEAAVAPGEVALYSWIKTMWYEEYSYPVISTISGEEPHYHDVVSNDTRFGRGWLTGNGVYSFELQALGSISVDIDPGSAEYLQGT